jgi:3-oxoadipate enol-lactonase
VKDTIVFVHGVGSTGAIWEYQTEAFGNEYQCLPIELRGNGARKPEPPAESITRDGFVDDVIFAADAVGAQRFHFVGCSLGGVVGFELWKRAARRVRTFTFVGSFAWYPDAQQYVDGVIASVRAAGSMERFAHERAKRLGMPAGKRADETIAQMACKSVESYIASTRATWTGEYRALLPTITVPTLVVCGENDAVAPAEFSREIAEGIGGAHLEIIEGAGHVANADAPERFNSLLRDFLQRTR